MRLKSFDIDALSTRTIPAASRSCTPQASRRAVLELDIDSLPHGVMVIDTAGSIRTINPALCRMLGQDAPPPGADFDQVLRMPELRDSIAQALATPDYREECVVALPADGEPQRSQPQYLRFAVSRAWLDDEKLVLVIAEDVTGPMLAKAELLRLASHDVLTGLANRSLLMDRLDQALAMARRGRRQVAVLFIDLDRFKNINDSLGHEAGDQVIVEAGRRLSASVRKGDTVARLGGDEFVVLMPDIEHSRAAAILSAKLQEALLLPMNVFGHEFSPICSIGISVYPRDGADSHALLKNADAAMYRAKELGRGTYQFYTEALNARTLERLRLEGGLRRALERHEFVLHYQPQVDLASGAVAGVEALLRWQPPGGPAVAPGQFIPIAEETGLIVEIGAWVLRTACEQLVAWRGAGLAIDMVAVNLSARQFQQQNLVPLVRQVLAETGCAAARLELEITESVVMADPVAATRTLEELSAMGIRLSIDDFGTGHSSLSYLKRFPIHALKIDRSFVRDLSTDADDAAIVCAVIALAHTMQLKVIAEGVETSDQLRFLREHDCDQLQGFYYSPPVTAEQIRATLGPA